MTVRFKATTTSLESVENALASLESAITSLEDYDRAIDIAISVEAFDLKGVGEKVGKVLKELWDKITAMIKRFMNWIKGTKSPEQAEKEVAEAKKEADAVKPTGDVKKFSEDKEVVIVPKPSSNTDEQKPPVKSEAAKKAPTLLALPNKGSDLYDIPQDAGYVKTLSLDDYMKHCIEDLRNHSTLQSWVDARKHQLRANNAAVRQFAESIVDYVVRQHTATYSDDKAAGYFGYHGFIVREINHIPLELLPEALDILKSGKHDKIPAFFKEYAGAMEESLLNVDKLTRVIERLPQAHLDAVRSEAKSAPRSNTMGVNELSLLIALLNIPRASRQDAMSFKPMGSSDILKLIAGRAEFIMTTSVGREGLLNSRQIRSLTTTVNELSNITPFVPQHKQVAALAMGEMVMENPHSTDELTDFVRIVSKLTIIASKIIALNQNGYETLRALEESRMKIYYAIGNVADIFENKES